MDLELNISQLEEALDEIGIHMLVSQPSTYEIQDRSFVGMTVVSIVNADAWEG